MTENELRIPATLENPDFDWRAIEGVSKETGFSKEEVTALIETA